MPALESPPFATSVPLRPPHEALLAEVFVSAHQLLLAKYAIEQGEYIVGRDATCHIIADADEVSRHHARLTFSGFELLIEDLGSGNGVYIDGVQVQIPTRIRADQEVQIGSARLVVRLKDSTSRQLTDALWDKDLGLEPVRSMIDGKKYRVITTLARGGMGVVMQARDLRIRRNVAMKVMKSSAQFSRENVLRFVDEAQLTGQLEHPNIVPVYDLGTDEQGEIFYSMKYVRGTTLDEVIRGLRAGRTQSIEKYPLSTLLTIFQKICDAMAFAHAKGVVHRDLKPENVMIGPYGEVLVMDWGLAKNMTGAERGEPGIKNAGEVQSAALSDGRGFQTMHGLIVGTPPYISPEQARGEIDTIDARSDIYVLGQILYAILTLRAPIDGADVQEIVANLLANRITPPLAFNAPPKSGRRSAKEVRDESIALVHCPGRRIPEGLAAVAMKAMQGDPAKRYQSVEEMQADLIAWQGGFATKAERATLLKHFLLWAGRHKGEVALIGVGVVFFIVLLISFIVQLTGEAERALTNERRALANERRAIEGEKLAAARLVELRGTAPVFFDEASTLLEEQKFTEALDNIDYAIEQVPQEAEYHYLRGNVLQSLFRWEEAFRAYSETLRLKPEHRAAIVNLSLTRKLLAERNAEGKAPPKLLRDFHEALLAQNRVGEALALLKEIGRDRVLFARTWRAFFAKRGMRDRFVSGEDETLSVDLSRTPLPDLRRLGHAPVVSLNLDDTRLTDIRLLKGRPLQVLSLNRTFVSDLSPLTGMPLRVLNADGTPIADLRPLSDLQLESLRLNDTRVVDLAPIRGSRIAELHLANCHRLKDLSPLRGMPLQTLDLSRTAVSDLTPIVGSPIRELNLEGCAKLQDLRPLLAMNSLEAVIIPAHCKEIGFLREHPGIKRLSYQRLTQTVEEFWQEYDRKRAGK